MDDARPVIHCLAGYEWADGCRCAPGVFTLEDAADLVRLGWTIVIDPFDVESLTRWEQMQRSVTKPWRRR